VVRRTILAVILAFLWADAAGAAAEEPSGPSWYGYQRLLVDAAILASEERPRTTVAPREPALLPIASRRKTGVALAWRF
jgi:hypothetical protein